MSDTNVDADPGVDTYGIALPAEWVRLPLERGDFDEFLRGQERRLAEQRQLSRTARRQFELIMRQLRNDCIREDITLAASLTLIIDPDVDPGTDPDVDPDVVRAGVAEDDLPTGAGLLAASCTISTVSRHAMGGDLPLTVNTIAAAMARQPTDTDGTEITNLDPPEVVELPAGNGVKVVRIVALPPDPVTLERLRMFAMYVFVPYDDGERAAVIAFATPTIQFARPLSRLFDEMMRTFRMFGGDQSTDPLAV